MYDLHYVCFPGCKVAGAWQCKAPPPESDIQVKEEATKAQKICGKLNKLT